MLTDLQSFITTANAAFYALTAIALIVLVMHRQVRDGIVVKSGLILIIVGHFAKFIFLVDGSGLEDIDALVRVNFLVNLGVTIVVAGWLMRTRIGRKFSPRRRTTDFTDLADEPQRAFNREELSNGNPR